MRPPPAAMKQPGPGTPASIAPVVSALTSSASIQEAKSPGVRKSASGSVVDFLLDEEDSIEEGPRILPESLKGRRGIGVGKDDESERLLPHLRAPDPVLAQKLEKATVELRQSLKLQQETVENIGRDVGKALSLLSGLTEQQERYHSGGNSFALSGFPSGLHPSAPQTSNLNRLPSGTSALSRALSNTSSHISPYLSAGSKVGGRDSTDMAPKTTLPPMSNNPVFQASLPRRTPWRNESLEKEGGHRRNRASEAMRPTDEQVHYPAAGPISFSPKVKVEGSWDPRASRGPQEIGEIAEELNNLKSKREKMLKQAKARHQVAIAFSEDGEESISRRDTLLSYIVQHPLFDTTCALMILLNSALIGWNVEYMVDHDNLTEHQELFSYVFAVFFTFELVLRVAAQGKEFFTKPDGRLWNLFDLLLVGFTLLDIFIEQIENASSDGESSESNSLASGMKTIKMLRIVRVFRVFRFFRELALLALMIADSLRSLMWALLMLIIITYVFAIIFTQGAGDYIKANGQSDIIGISEVQRQFGSLGRTSYILGQAMLGGVSWGVVSDALLTIDVSLPALFFFYIAFTMLAVLNIITGVFVDNAVETANQQRDVVVQKELELKEKMIVQLRTLFGEMDKEGVGSITVEQVQEFLSDSRVSSYFAALGLDATDAERLFHLIDDDDSGDVSVDEFLHGCLRLKGPARSIDVHALLHAHRRLENQLERAIPQLADEAVRRMSTMEARGMPVGHMMQDYAPIASGFFSENNSSPGSRHASQGPGYPVSPQAGVVDRTCAVLAGRDEAHSPRSPG